MKSPFVVMRYNGECLSYTRGRDHLRGLQNKNKLWKDVANEHGGDENIKFSMKVLKSYGRDNMTRKANEAARINGNKGVRLNSKAEYRQPHVPRLVIHPNINE